MDGKNLVIGIDFGSSDSYVGYIGSGIVDIVQNEVSQRKTPTLAGFTDRERLLGDAALSQIKSNVKNTCRNFKHLIGQKFDSPAVEQEQSWSTAPIVADEDGLAAFSVSYKGEQRTLSTVAITAMFFTKLINITEAWCQGTVADAVVAVPSYFTDIHRTALLDAAKVAGLNVLRVMNEHTATALGYGFYRKMEDDKTHTVAFCCMGHTVFSVAIVQFTKGKLTVLCERSDKVGGRDMDECLMRAFAQQFQKKHGCDPLSSKKAAFKLEDAVTKTKKILSANSEAPISVECLMEDEDFSSTIDRATFLEMCDPMMKKVNGVLEAAKAMAGPIDIDVVEICGGASRVPWLKEMCSKAFGGKELSTTMNADECVARGCTLQAALLSPHYKVREYSVEDTAAFPVRLSWIGVPPPAAANGEEQPAGDAGERSAVVFPENSLTNVRKVLTFFRKEPFELKAAYGSDAALPANATRELGTYKVDIPEQQTVRKVKVKAALTVHGTFTIEGAHMVEEVTDDAGGEDGENRPANSPPEGGDGAKGDDAAKEVSKDAGQDGDEAKENNKENVDTEEAPAKRRKRMHRTDLAVTSWGRPGLSEEALQRRSEEEQVMRREMQEIVETNARRNDLESYILGMRGGIEEGAKYGAFITASERSAFSEQLAKAEEWLYDHTDDGKQVFIDKMAELREFGGPVEKRFRESERRRELAKDLEEAMEKYKAKGVASLEAVCGAVQRWLTDMEAKQEKVAFNEDPVLTCDAIEGKHQELLKVANQVLGDKEAGDVPPPSSAPSPSPSPNPTEPQAQGPMAGQGTAPPPPPRSPF